MRVNPMQKMKRALSTTSYAILGWLAVRPWPIYELAEQTRRNLRFFWPRADSRLYEEPKNLVAHKLAKVQRTFVGKRPRTIYAITPKGRRVLRQWLGRQSRSPSLEFEALVRVFFADAGSLKDLRATLDGAGALADEIRGIGLRVAQEFLDGVHPFPERMHLSGLVFDFLWGWADHLQRWSEDARAEVARWNSLGPVPGDAKARVVFERARHTTPARRPRRR